MAEAPTAVLEAKYQQARNEQQKLRENVPPHVREAARRAYPSYLAMEALKLNEALPLATTPDSALPKVFGSLPNGAKKFAAIEKVQVLPKNRRVQIPVLPATDEEIVSIVRDASPREGNTERPGLAYLYNESIAETPQMLTRYITDSEYLTDKHDSDHAARRAVKKRYTDENNKEVTDEERREFREYRDHVGKNSGFRGNNLGTLIDGLQGALHFQAVNPDLAQRIHDRGYQLYFLRLGDPEHGIPSYEEMNYQQKVALVRMGVDYAVESLREMAGDRLPLSEPIPTL